MSSHPASFSISQPTGPTPDNTQVPFAYPDGHYWPQNTMPNPALTLPLLRQLPTPLERPATAIQTALPHLPAPRILEDNSVTRHGHPSGARNYTNADMKALLKFIEAELPLGNRGWRVVHAWYTKWAHTNRRPERTLKSLDTKFRQVCFILLLSCVI